MISSFLVHKLEEKEKAREDSAITLVYYFCNNKDESCNTALALLRGLLLQLLRKRPILFNYAEGDYNKMKDRLFKLFENLDSLWRILPKMLKDNDASKVCVLVDALDECERSSRQSFLTYLEKLFTMPQLVGNINIKFLIACRLNRKIDKILCMVRNCLRLDLANINADLSKFINDRVNTLSSRKRYLISLKQNVKIALTNKARGTFLWVSLVLEDLGKEDDLTKVP